MVNELCFFNVDLSCCNLNWSVLYTSIANSAEFFGIYCLPEELKLKINICSEEEFHHKKVEMRLPQSNDALAFTCCVNCIYVLEYGQLSRNMVEMVEMDYHAIVVHECIHVFQEYYSMLPPHKHVWLYETIACFMARQTRAYTPERYPSWENFVTDFYSIDNCYGLAYQFGKHLFQCLPKTILLDVIRDPAPHMEALRLIYARLHYI